MAALSRKNEAWPESALNERGSARPQKDRLVEAFMIELSIKNKKSRVTFSGPGNICIVV